MINIIEKIKSPKEFETKIPSGIHMIFENGNTISIQFGYGNYCENRNESNSYSETAEIAMWNSEGTWYEEWEEGDVVKGYCTTDEVADWIKFCKENTW